MTRDLPEVIAKLAERDEPLVVVNSEGVVVTMSEAATKLWGVDASDVVGEYVEMLVPSNLRWGHQAYRRGFLAEPSERDMAEGMSPHLERPANLSQVAIAVHLEPITVDGQLFVAAHVSERDGD